MLESLGIQNIKMIDFIARTSLLGTSEYFIIALVSIGYLTYQKAPFARGLFLLLFTMVLNPFLKDIWQIPLNPDLGKVGYAFPSGHMQTAAAFWLWLAYDLKKPLFKGLVVLLLCAIGFSLQHFGYHTLMDILGALGFAGISLLFYGFWMKRLKETYHPYIGLCLAFAGLPLIYLTSTHNAHVWIATGALVGFSLGWALYHRQDPETWLFKKRFKVACGLGGIVLLYGLTEPLKNVLPREALHLLRYFLIAFWVSYGAELCVTQIHKVSKKVEKSP